jgi:type IV pilus assembly protein PilF
MRNCARWLWICLSLAGILAGCTTTQTTKTISPAADNSQVQANDSKRAAIRLQLAIDYFQQDQLATALKELNNALSIDPNLSQAYSVRALVYMQMQENDLAEQDFQKATRLTPNSSDNDVNYGWFLCQTGREKQGIELFDRVIKDRMYAQPTKALNNAGICSLKLKDATAAESYFMQSVRLDASNPTTNLNLAGINYRRHDYPRAQFYIDRVIKADSYSAEILWLAIRINHRLGDQGSVVALSAQLHKRFPDSDEDALSQRGAYDE